MTRIGIIGLGFMGMIHYYGAKKVDGCQVTAICTRDPQKLTGDWSSIQGTLDLVVEWKTFLDYH